MKVTICPKCRITPDVEPKRIRCPKCGKTSIGENLNDALTKWNDHKYDEGSIKVAVKDEEVIKEEAKEEVKVARRPSTRGRKRKD